ncbi:hypothetical protein VCHA40P242_130071 [Vibrio chagasii]|nr:hypothetical protein VCHA36P164_150036 [Vibrio chagasii]CAH6917708.1 hypothetical protein VCHA40P242_130071 [Vibrio chagasii]
MADGAGLKKIYDDVSNDRYKRGTVLLMYLLIDSADKNQNKQRTTSLV